MVDVWKQAYRLLLDDGNRFNLTLHIRQPLSIAPLHLRQCDPNRVHQAAKPLRDVATTIFPARSRHWDASVLDFTEYYAPVYDRLLRRGQRLWGCYFLRLVSFGSEEINQLERVVGGLGTWGRRHHAAFVVHFSASTLDRPRPQGGPCLQYVELMVNSDQRLCATALYRSHDYFHKALGNLLGLSRLLHFVALKTNHEVGTLTCVSTYAFVAISKRRANALWGAASN
jgi:hypothetical protein